MPRPGANLLLATLFASATAASIGCNFFGDGSDGAGSFTSSTNLPVADAADYDGKMIVKQYTTLNIASGATLTTYAH